MIEKVMGLSTVRWCVPLAAKFQNFKTSFETWLPTLAVPLLPHSSCLITKLRTSFSGSSFLRPPVCVLCRICRSHPKIMKKKSKSVNHRRVRRKRVQQQQLSSFRGIETKTTRRSCCRRNRKKLGKKNGHWVKVKKKEVKEPIKIARKMKRSVKTRVKKIKEKERTFMRVKLSAKA